MTAINQHRNCPSWCSHHFCDASRPPSDWIHRSTLNEFEADVLHRELDLFGNGVFRSSEPAEFNVHALRYPDDERAWVAIVTDQAPVVITVESAIALRDALGDLLQDLS